MTVLRADKRIAFHYRNIPGLYTDWSLVNGKLRGKVYADGRLIGEVEVSFTKA